MDRRDVRDERIDTVSDDVVDERERAHDHDHDHDHHHDKKAHQKHVDDGTAKPPTDGHLFSDDAKKVGGESKELWREATGKDKGR